MHLFMLPTEVRLQIYEELLACPSVSVEYVPCEIHTTKSRFQLMTWSPLSPSDSPGLPTNPPRGSSHLVWYPSVQLRPFCLRCREPASTDRAREFWPHQTSNR